MVKELFHTSTEEQRAHLASVVGIAFGQCARTREGRLQVELAPDLRPLPGDPQQLYRALRNLITNALRHTPPDGTVLLTVEAGEDWDDVVAGCVADGLGGLECLSGIPGRLGATPVQNVGAYGVEVADLLVDADLYDRSSATVRRVPAAGLGLGYRTSRLKRSDAAIVLRARFALRPDGLSAPVRYPELAAALGVPAGARVPAGRAREAVLARRRRKGMVLDPADHDTWSVGSFFTNPVLPDTGIDGVPDGVPRWAAGSGYTKLSAAALIERAGVRRGHPGPGGRVAVSHKHTLALTNRGPGTTEDLLELARTVREAVSAVFGVVLEPEPVLVGCSL